MNAAELTPYSAPFDECGKGREGGAAPIVFEIALPHGIGSREASAETPSAGGQEPDPDIARPNLPTLNLSDRPGPGYGA